MFGRSFLEICAIRHGYPKTSSSRQPECFFVDRRCRDGVDRSCARVLHGGRTELNDYLSFLKGGCSKYPLDLLRGAGVDMEKPDAVNTALEHFGRLVGELEELL